MKNTETIAEYEYRLKMLAKNSKDLSTHFKFISNDRNKIVYLK